MGVHSFLELRILEILDLVSLKTIHDKVNEQLRHTFQLYKSNADLNMRHKEFEKSDLVMVYL